ncbi:MAG: acyltransferase [Rhodospirillaceae bacterium]|nr:acyltransferase [Rhodospirillaceae bacterium]
MSPGYRPDIDGLRALAVLPVIFYHAGFPGVAGGYEGVDVFFVISGYLITSLILREMEAGNFSIQVFWLRRVRRILPALFLVIIATLVAFSLVYPPHLYLELGQSVLAQTVFASNVLFWQESGYFDSEAHLKPLLHTWSLSVEEQFYLIFPAVLMLLGKFFAAWRFSILLIIALGSLALSVWGAGVEPDAAFYLLPTRAWELGIGCLLAFKVVYRDGSVGTGSWVNEFWAGLGLLGLVLSVIGYDRTTPYPSFYALLPCLSTAMIIWAGSNRRTVVGHVLTWRPVVFVGLISYSLYLWHWPVLVLQRALALEEPGTLAKGGALILSVLLAWLSYRFVETPIRRNIAVFTNPRLVVGTLLVVAMLGIAGTTIHIQQGIPARFSESALQIAAAGEARNPRRQDCVWSKQQGQFSDTWFCRPDPTHPIVKPQLLIWGDSHADALQPLLDGLAREHGVESHFAAYSACPAIAGLDRVNEDASHQCRKFNDYMVNYAIRKKIPNVLLISRFNLYTNGRDRFKQHLPPPLITSDPTKGEASVTSARKDFKAAATAMITKLAQHGIRTYVLLQVPNYNIEPTAYGLKLAIRGRAVAYERPRREIQARQRFVSETFTELSHLGVVVIDPTEVFCDQQSCSPYIDGRSAYRDEHHLSNYGAAQLRPSLVQVFSAPK